MSRPSLTDGLWLQSGNEEMFKHLLSGRVTNGWQLRKIIETHTSYDTAIKAIAAVPYVSTEYAIISGVRKGIIFAKVRICPRLHHLKSAQLGLELA